MIKRALLLAFVGLFGITYVQAATYNKDLIVGFTSESGTDLIYDLGTAASLTNGQSWNLTNLLSNANHNGSSYSTLQWGVIGATNPLNKCYTTCLSFPSVNNDYIGTKTLIGTIYQNFSTAGVGQYLITGYSGSTSWYSETTVNGGLLGGTTFIGNWVNPNKIGTGSITFYEAPEGSTPTVFGTFTFDNSGKLTFTLPSNTPPPPQIVSITRTNTTSYITFTTTNGGFNYSLYFTNSLGLTTSVTNWPHSESVVGDGLNKTLTDTTMDNNRFYRVKVQ